MISKNFERRIQRLKSLEGALSIEQKIGFAIKHKFKLDFDYSDESEEVLNGYRDVSPAALGTLKTTKNKALRAYFNEGVSKSERMPKWRLFLLSRMSNVGLNYSKFRTNGLYRMNDKHMEDIEIQIIKSLKSLLQ